MDSEGALEHLYDNKNSLDDYPTVERHVSDFLRIHSHPIFAASYHVFLYQLTNLNKQQYIAFCSGNIITSVKVLTSAHCLLTNRKRLKRKLNTVTIVGGARTVVVYRKKEPDETQQWRTIKIIYSQKYLRYPSFSLSVLLINKPWRFNVHVNYIPIASRDYDYDGICNSTVVRTLTSWASSKVLTIENNHMIKQGECEVILQRSCRIFYCTAYETVVTLVSIETEGGGLVCQGTGDPNEIAGNGVLVGITTLVNIHLPSLHHRIAIFSKWIENSSNNLLLHNEVISVCLLLALVIFLF